MNFQGEFSDKWVKFSLIPRCLPISSDISVCISLQIHSWTMISLYLQYITWSKQSKWHYPFKPVQSKERDVLSTLSTCFWSEKWVNNSRSSNKILLNNSFKIMIYIYIYIIKTKTKNQINVRKGSIGIYWEWGLRLVRLKSQIWKTHSLVDQMIRE